MRYLLKLNNNYVDIQELKILSSNIENYYSINPVVSSEVLYKSLEDYIEWILNYTNGIFQGKIISYDNLAPTLFCVNGFKKKSAYKEFVKNNLYALRSYIQALKSTIDIRYIDRYKTLLLNLCCESEFAIVEYEKYYNKAPSSLMCAHGRRPELSTLDMSFAMNELFFIEHSDFSKFDYRDIKPNTIFIIRQFLEIFWRNVIGYSNITEQYSNAPIKKFTQVAWQFIEVNNKAGSRWYIQFPLKTKTISLVNTWANSFVHKTYIYDSHIQYMAMLVCRELMKVPLKSVQCFIDTNHPQAKMSTHFGDIRIKNYYALMDDFESDIKHKMPNSKINWLALQNVGAYIVTVGKHSQVNNDLELNYLKKYIYESFCSLCRGVYLYLKVLYGIADSKFNKIFKSH